MYNRYFNINFVYILNRAESPDINCRICLYSDNKAENPLVSPCGCTGSVKYVHIDCLKQWIKSKGVSRTTGVSTEYRWKKIYCELCNRDLPSRNIVRV